MTRFASGTLTLLVMLALIASAPALAKVLRGTNGEDKLVGSNRGDKIYGKRGDDVLRGSKGGDFIRAGGGGDFVKGGKGFDEVRAGKGDDEIHVRDGRPDLIDCGPGEDTVLADEVEDGIFNCEDVQVLES